MKDSQICRLESAIWFAAIMASPHSPYTIWLWALFWVSFACGAIHHAAGR